ncbi:MAG: 3-deoxy-7-phosphoheptulonate synthase, partial [Firmicutes bacterium]|nr:3-deoxy-7-phosphoheptulonate synthase [Bacillota bacterium]
MIIVMRSGADPRQIVMVEERLREFGFRTHSIYGQEKTVIGAVGDKRVLSAESIS